MGIVKRSTRYGIPAIVICILLTPAFLLADDASFSMAVASYKKGDFKTAVHLLKEHVEKKPDPSAYYLLGYALYKQKRHAEALRYFQAAYMLDPGISPAMER